MDLIVKLVSLKSWLSHLMLAFFKFPPYEILSKLSFLICKTRAVVCILELCYELKDINTQLLCSWHSVNK